LVFVSELASFGQCGVFVAANVVYCEMDLDIRRYAHPFKFRAVGEELALGAEPDSHAIA
jgi:hypothetical protein